MMAYAPSPEQKSWVGILRTRTADAGHVTMYGDVSEQHRVAVYTGRIGSEWIGATVGLMDVDQSGNPEVEIHTEILMERRGSAEYLGNILSTIAFFAMKNGWKIAPDIIFENMVSMYLPQTHLPHVMFVPVFRWDDMSKAIVASKVIYPLLTIPISQAESELVARDGPGALMSRLAERKSDVMDWERSCVA